MPDTIPIEPAPATTSIVEKWVARITGAKSKFDSDFKRMREDMEFVGGIQWAGQETLQGEDRYINNVVLREVNRGVDALYARNPKAIARRRERMDFRVWDGHQETLVNASQSLMSGVPDPMSMSVVNDYVQGEQQRTLLDNLAKTLEIEYQIQVDRQEPNFKQQMKQLVRRVKVCGIGYVRVSFKREQRILMSANQDQVSPIDRAKKISQLVQEFEKGDFDKDSEKFREIEMLMNATSSINAQDVREMNERLVFDFPRATSVIVDPACTLMNGFVGARWIAQEYVLPLEDVKATFGKPDLTVSAGVKQYSSDGEVMPNTQPDRPGELQEPFACVWEVFDKATNSRFFLCDGYRDFLMEPEEPRPRIQRFWPIIPLTFNPIESEPGLKVSIYPPSDVRLMRASQLEWNRSRQALRVHRDGNRPKYMTGVGWLTPQDKEMLKNPPDNAVIELLGVAPGTDISKLLAPFHHAPIEQALYDTSPLEKDILVTVGAQQANIGPITSRGTATEATISEQSRISSISSNVDDLDSLLSEMANVGGEMMLREMSLETVKRDAGDGAIWPMTDRDKYVDRIYLEIQAASSGRPNQGLRIANARDILPLALNAGANPQFVVEELIKAYDERIDVQRAFPVVPPGLKQGVGPAQPSQPVGGAANETPAGNAIPLPVQTDANLAQANNAKEQVQ